MELAEDARYANAGCVGMDSDWTIRIEMFENGGGGETTLEFGLAIG